MTLKNNSIVLSLLLAVSMIVLAIEMISLNIVSKTPEKVLGSVPVGNQYLSTTTPTVLTHTNLCPARSGMASSTTGVLGSVNITLQGTNGWNIFDATTTNINLRSADQATSTIRLAHFGSATPAGSYHFDIEFDRGLLIDYGGTNTASSTISYRCEG